MILRDLPGTIGDNNPIVLYEMGKSQEPKIFLVQRAATHIFLSFLVVKQLSRIPSITTWDQLLPGAPYGSPLPCSRPLITQIRSCTSYLSGWTMEEPQRS